MAAVESSYTGQYLSEILAGREVPVGDEPTLIGEPTSGGKNKTTPKRKGRKATTSRKKSR